MRSMGRVFWVLCVVAGGISLQLQAPARQERMAQKTAKSEFEQKMVESIEKMDRDMMAAPTTGEPDHDFATMMIAHHRGAVDMAQLELIYGKDPVLRRLAQEIIVTQEQEIEVMRVRLKRYEIK